MIYSKLSRYKIKKIIECFSEYKTKCLASKILNGERPFENKMQHISGAVIQEIFDNFYVLVHYVFKIEFFEIFADVWQTLFCYQM